MAERTAGPAPATPAAPDVPGRLRVPPGGAPARSFGGRAAKRLTGFRVTVPVEAIEGQVSRLPARGVGQAKPTLL